MNNININGKSYSVSGNNVSVSNGKIIVDGKTIEKNLSGDVKIIWKGDLATLDCNNAEIHGNVNGKVDANNVKCMNIYKNVDANTVKGL